mmetsp:Transcript_24020/g.51214  ORF Transcript_24020/g.51214 Transcript_24020/m.51214 type:complete len:289 (-) Transcript_24020:327-1193(-)
MLADQRGMVADGKRGVEPGSRGGLLHRTPHWVVGAHDSAVVDHLGVREDLLPGVIHQGGGDIISLQHRKSLLAGESAQCFPNQIHTSSPVGRKAGGGIKPWVFPPLLVPQRPTDPRPLLHGVHSTGDIPTLAIINKVAGVVPSALGSLLHFRVATAHKGVPSHALRPGKGQNSVQHRYLHVLTPAGAELLDQGSADGLCGGDGGNLVRNDQPHHPRPPRLVRLQGRQPTHRLHNGVVYPLLGVGSRRAEPGDRHVDDLRVDALHILIPNPHPVRGPGTKITDHNIRAQ